MNARKLLRKRYLAILSVCASPALAADRYWTGGGGADQDWSNAANWGNIQPTSSDLAYIPYGAGSSAQAIITQAGTCSALYLGYGDMSTGNLTVQAGGQLTTANTSYLGYFTGARGTATITGAGSAWTGNGQLYIGKLGAGTLNILDGAQVTSQVTYLAYTSGSQGTVTVSGAGSTWSNSSTVFVGNAASGSLTIQSGATVSNKSGFLGSASGGTSTTSVMGAGSTWTNSDAVFLRKGTLTVSDGGLVTAQNLWASLSDLHGDGTITLNKGAVLDTDLVFDATHGFSQTLAFGSGGRLNLSLDGTGVLGVGYNTIGTLRIADGVVVTSTSGNIGYNCGLGYNSGSSGTATITGAGSAWVNNGNLTIGYGAGSTGNATVTGPGAALTNSGDLYIAYLPGSTGAVTVTGDGAAVTSSHGLAVGFQGSGSLAIQNGAHVSDQFAYVGDISGSRGSATVTGPGSTWTNSGGLYIGNYGSGTLTVADGALVSAAPLCASLSDLYGNGTITAIGGELDTNLVFDATHGFSQTLPFGSGGQLNLTVDSSHSLGVGWKKTGTLRIADGLAVTTDSGMLGDVPGSTGTATVTGAGSNWTMSSGLTVGSNGNGVLNVQAGAQVNSAYGYIGRYVSGTANVTGAGSKWIIAGDLGVASSNLSNGTLNVQNGGQVSDTNGLLGGITGGSGTATVSGPGSAWINRGTLGIGVNSGTDKSMLTVADSGKVWARSLTIGNSRSMVRLLVGGNDMIVLGDADTVGHLYQFNTLNLNLYAGPSLAPGDYHPISEFAGRAMTPNHSSAITVGGTWNATTYTFTASPITLKSAGDVVQNVSTAQRLLFTDTATGTQLAASFGTMSSGQTFSASAMAQSDVNKLLTMPGFTGSVFSAWKFTTNITDEVLLSAHIDPTADSVQVWRYQSGAWAQFAPSLMNCSTDGMVSFTTAQLSGYGYAVTATPEPATLALLSMGASLLLAARPKHRRAKLRA